MQLIKQRFWKNVLKKINMASDKIKTQFCENLRKERAKGKTKF